MTSVSPNFPGQWVCLQNQQHYLYGELIQVVVARGTVWLRPIILVEQVAPLESPLSVTPSVWTDLRQGPDLLLPMELVRPALDTEVLPLLSLLAQAPPAQAQLVASSSAEHGRRQLNQLIHRLWQAHPTSFQVPPIVT